MASSPERDVESRSNCPHHVGAVVTSMGIGSEMKAADKIGGLQLIHLLCILRIMFPHLSSVLIRCLTIPLFLFLR